VLFFGLEHLFLFLLFLLESSFSNVGSKINYGCRRSRAKVEGLLGPACGTHEALARSRTRGRPQAALEAVKPPPLTPINLGLCVGLFVGKDEGRVDDYSALLVKL